MYGIVPAQHLDVIYVTALAIALKQAMLASCSAADIAGVQPSADLQLGYISSYSCSTYTRHTSFIPGPGLGNEGHHGVSISYLVDILN